MKTPKLLTEEIMDSLSKEVGKLNMDLCKVLDTMTDENCKPLPCVNAGLVKKLQKIALNIYTTSELIEEEKFEIITQIEEYDIFANS